MKTMKCQPPKSPYHKRDFNVCTDPYDFDPLFMENVNDIADTMAEVMIICGIHRCKAKNSRLIVIGAFQFYDIKRHRFETADNECGICRTDIVRDFERQCSMTHVEALLAYCIVKRAIKAFFNGTPDHSIRSPVAEAVVVKQQEFAWLHAARRTIMIFERYEQMFFEAQLNYAKQILKIYKELHERLKSRADPVIIEDYHPRGCVQKIVIGTKSPPKLESERQVCVSKCKKLQDLKKIVEDLSTKRIPIHNCLTLPSPCALMCRQEKDNSHKESFNELTPAKKIKASLNPDLNLPRCYQCNCPKIICDCDIDRDTGVVAIDCSQGPFACQWVRMDKCDKSDPCIEKPEYHQCPVDCATSDSSNGSDASEYCECSAESNKDEDDYDDDIDSVGNERKLNVMQEPLAEAENVDMLEHLMPRNSGQRNSVNGCRLREISKLPLLKCDHVINEKRE